MADRKVVDEVQIGEKTVTVYETAAPKVKELKAALGRCTGAQVVRCQLPGRGSAKWLWSQLTALERSHVVIEWTERHVVTGSAGEAQEAVRQGAIVET